MQTLSAGSMMGLKPTKIPTTTDPYFSNVSLLLPLDGTDAATTSTDASIIGNALTFESNAQLDTSQSKFGGSSLLLDGSLDNISMPSNTWITLGTSDFTMEAHIRFNGSIPSTSTIILGSWEDTTNRGWAWSWQGAAGNLGNGYSTTGSNIVAPNINSWAPVADTWYHVAWCREGTKSRQFVDGIQLGADVEIGTDSIRGATVGAHVGRVVGPTEASSQYWNGWIDNVRITKGTARYTKAGFSVPTEAFTSGNDTDFSSVTLLLNLDGTDGATSTTDASNSAQSVTFVGTAQLDTAQLKFGTASVLLDGNSDELTVPYTSSLDMSGSEDFTAECWIRVSTMKTCSIFNQSGRSGTAWPNWQIAIATNKLTGRIGNAAAPGSSIGFLTGTTTLVINTWYHVALVWQFGRGVMEIFVNGISEGHAYGLSAPTNSTTNGFEIGHQDNTSDFFDGWIDDVRITKGVARYTSNFTPPSAPYPTS